MLDNTPTGMWSSVFHYVVDCPDGLMDTQSLPPCDTCGQPWLAKAYGITLSLSNVSVRLKQNVFEAGNITPIVACSANGFVATCCVSCSLCACRFGNGVTSPAASHIDVKCSAAEIEVFDTREEAIIEYRIEKAGEICRVSTC